MCCNFLQGISTCFGMVSSTACKVDVCSNMGLSRGCSGICSSAWSTSSSTSVALVSAVLFLTLFAHFSLSRCCAASSPFLKTLSLRCHHLGWGAHLCPAVGLLESAMCSAGQPLPPHRDRPYSHPTASTWARKPGKTVNDNSKLDVKNNMDNPFWGHLLCMLVYTIL